MYTTLKRRLSYWMHAVEFVTGIATMSGRLVPSQFEVGDGSLPLEVGSGPPLSALFQRHRRHLLLTARRSMMRREDRTRVVPYVDGPAVCT